MWMFLTNMLSSPRRALATIAVVLVLLIALALAGPATLQALAEILGLSGLLLIFRVPLRIVLPLCFGAILIAGAVSLVTEALTLGVLPLVGAGVLAVGTIGLWTVAFRSPPKPRGARWATIRDLRRAGFLGAHGFPLGTVDGHTVRLPMELERQSTLVTATTGSGKTSILVIPPLIEETERPVEELRSIVVLDPKDELARATMPTLARTHRVLLWDPSDPDACTVGFDPLSTLPEPSDESFVAEVKQLAQSWFWATRGGMQTTDPFWINQPRSLMEALFLAFLVNRPEGTFGELADWTRTLKIEEFQVLLDRATHPALRASAETLRTLGMSDRTVGPIFADVLQRFDVLDDPRVRRSMTGAPVDGSFVTQPTALYLRVGAQDAERLAPLVSMALGQLYRELRKIAARSPGNKLNRDVRIYADEFGNLPHIHGIETALNTLRSYGVGHFLFVQGTNQLVHHYGRELATTIQENVVTRVILGGAAAGDAKAFSERCGEVTEYHPHPGWTRQGLFGRGSRSFSYSPQRRPLIAPDEIMHMRRDTVLVSTRGISPIRAVAKPYFTDPATVRRLQKDQAEFAPPAQAAPQSSAPAPAMTQQGKRDVPPPGCSVQEWDAAAASLRVARWSMEDDLFDLVTGRAADIAAIQERWRTDPSRPTPDRYAKVTAAERARTPNLAAYVDELALRLQLREEGGAV